MTLADHRLFGRTGLRVHPLALGCMNFGGRTSREESLRIIDRALDAGINVVDTANGYARGRSEELVGEALVRNGRRHEVILCTKFYMPMDDNLPNERGISRRHLIAQCEQSLRRLGTDYIDLYQVHRPQSEVAIDETLRALDDLVRAGKVRYIGSSTFAAWQVVEALWVSKELGLNRFVSEQPPYNLLDRRIERELIPVAQTYSLALMAWSPMAGGLLTGKYGRNQPMPENSRYATPTPVQARHLTPRIYDAVDALLPLAQAKGLSLGLFALAWTLQNPAVTCSILGPRTLEHLEQCLGILAIRFNEEELTLIDRIIPPGTHVAPIYEADFGAWKHRG